jgi:beta-lactamase superfamily II metal-dependent hydrolase
MPEAFAGYPAPFVHDQPGGRKVQQLLWGDWLELSGESQDDWVEVSKARNASGWMRSSDIGSDRLLEINFVDVGQGDGCLVVTPDDRRILIDAGRQDNMSNYLRWRFNLRNRPDSRLRIDAALISHPDSDHYEGFGPLLDDEQIEIGTLYHTGLVDHAESPRLGPTETVGAVTYYTELFASMPDLADALPRLDPGESMHYPGLLRTALSTGRVDDIRSLSSRDEELPEFSSDDLRIEVLGPVTESVGDKFALRRLGADDITKNGHSIVVMLCFGAARFLLGGDLNQAAMEFLLQHYGEDLDADSSQSVFRADVAKACHHGSADVSTDFVARINAIATVVSSGDNESYSHPRPDALGILGKHGRGERPLIFSTELARSAREERAGVSLSGAIRELAPRTADEVERAIAVYGMITVRSDGTNVVMAQKLERPTGFGTSWDVHCLEQGPDGLHYNSAAG